MSTGLEHVQSNLKINNLWGQPFCVGTWQTWRWYETALVPSVYSTGKGKIALAIADFYKSAIAKWKKLITIMTTKALYLWFWRMGGLRTCLQFHVNKH